ncbi:GNAT family N-acetyltransferase [Vibrio hippocampi]|uniref:N-acetyltransferase YafP n=1 Tax=Vibrio hippocampi TaxID=654686 RepID=A0ABN8DQL3_9VIBR|nr:GNAT family N-acetyltransferase [Vibrio hippocampi]CAH0530438.1 putative N-acetyltransferase YafP [Vibrio hippocampi]
MIKIRKYQHCDARALWQLKQQTIRRINSRDYSLTQVRAWAPDEIDPAIWQKRVDGMNPFIALIGDKIVGFADLQADGYIDHFFCHADHQSVGVGRALMQQILTQADNQNIARLYSAVSLTAKPFYQHFGFQVVKQQQVETRGETLTNFIMERRL